MRGPLVPYTSLRCIASQISSRLRPLLCTPARPPFKKNDEPRSVSKIEKIAVLNSSVALRDIATGSRLGV